MIEEQVIIQHAGEGLFGVMYRPASDPIASILFCNPLFEERKSAHRALVETARALCADGYAVLRFDYRGCGDSGGDFTNFGYDAWQADIVAAAHYLRERAAAPRCGLLGLRLGATLALRACLDALDVDFAIAWEPVLDGRAHLEQELRKKLMKQMLTAGKTTDSRDALTRALQEGGSIDFDGFAINAGLYRDITGDRLREATRLHTSALYVMSLNASGKPAPAVQTWADGLAGGATRVTVQALRLPPFWNLIGLADITPLIEETRQWLRPSNNP